MELSRSAASAGWELGVRWVVQEMAKPWQSHQDDGMSGPGPGVQLTRRGLELTGDSVRSLDEGHDSVVSDPSVCRPASPHP